MLPEKLERFSTMQESAARELRPRSGDIDVREHTWRLAIEEHRVAMLEEAAYYRSCEGYQPWNGW
jgi:hypothetical protein